ncbi:MAG: hypothetical protein AAB214_20285 [Fibrobacterota bacterium]
MKTLRIAALTTMFAAFGLMTGCDLFGTESTSNTSPTISETRVDNTTLNADGTSATSIRGLVADDKAGLNVTFKVLDASSADKSTNFDITFTQVPSADKEWSIGSPDQGGAKIKAKTTAASGAYKLQITLKDADGASTSADVSFSVAGGTTVVTLAESSVNLGGSGSALPSFLDADGMVAMSGTAAKADPAAVDLRFNNTSDSKNEVRAPSEDASLTWTKKNATKFHKVAAGSYTAATTAAAVEALYSTTSAQSTQLILADGDELLVKTVEGNYRIIKVSITANSGKTNVEFSVKGKK